MRKDAQAIIQQAVGFRTGRDEVKLSNVRLSGEIGPPEPDAELFECKRPANPGIYGSVWRGQYLSGLGWQHVILAIAFVPLLLLRRLSDLHYLTRNAAAEAPTIA